MIINGPTALVLLAVWAGIVHDRYMFAAFRKNFRERTFRFEENSAR